MAKKKLPKVLAAYTPEKRARPICPNCYSRPDIDWGRRTGPSRTPRGWDLAVEDRRRIFDGRKVHVSVIIYRCANLECDTAIKVRSILGEIRGKRGKYLPEDVNAGILKGDKALEYLEGGFDKQGVWTKGGTVPPIRAEEDMLLLEMDGTPVVVPDDVEIVDGNAVFVNYEDYEEEEEPEDEDDDEDEVDDEEEVVEEEEEEEEDVEPEPVAVPAPEVKEAAEFERNGPWLYIDSPIVQQAPKPWTRDKKTGRLKVRYGTNRYQQVWDWFFDRGIEIP